MPISILRVRPRSTRIEDNWRGALDYSWTPVYKAWEPFKKLKNKSKWLDILKRFGLNWLPQNIAFNTEMTHETYELQERDMESTTQFAVAAHRSANSSSGTASSLCAGI